MMEASLVIMAAGLGSRYGGDKQVDGVGPHGEILMEYGIYDALKAGFHRVVFIIKPGMEKMVERLCGHYLRRCLAADGSQVEVAYAVQDFRSLPSWYTLPSGRIGPMGTVHALLCAEEAVRGEPFCVINADDYYGAGAYETIFRELGRLRPAGHAAMVGYLLRNTASIYGAVSRGICAVEEGTLKSIRETKRIQLYPDGTLKDLNAKRELDPDTPVSMNFWGFQPSVFPVLRRYFEDFLRSPAGRELQSECLLPVMVGDLLEAGELEVTVRPSTDRWFGMTYREDREIVAKEVRKLHAAGIYPESLRDV